MRSPRQHEPAGTPAAGLVELADQIVTAHGGGVPFLPAWLSQQGLSHLLAVPVVGGGALAARSFDFLTSERPSPHAEPLTDSFDVIAFPLRFIDRDLHPGDLLVRRGDADFAHVAVLISPTLWRALDIAAAGDEPEAFAPGWYAYVIEGGARPHCRQDGFARLILGPDGRVPANQLILRRRWASATATTEGTSAEDDPATIGPFPDSALPDLPRDALTGKLQAAFSAAVLSVGADQDRRDTKDPTKFAIPDLRNLIDAQGNLLKPSDIPLCIVALNADKSPVAAVGQHETLVFYSGSLIKVGALYAAFQLRHAVNRLAAALKPRLTVADFWRQVRTQFDHIIRTAVPLLQSASIQRAPQYETIFTPTLNSAGLYTVDFQESTDDTRKNFKGHLREIIVNSHNQSAGFCIQMLGYNCINGALEKAGLFRRRNGIWLAGDYLPARLNPKDDSAYTEEIRKLGIIGGQVVTIDSVNDKQVKQAATCIDLAKLFVHLAQDDLVDTSRGTPNADMLALLHDAVTGFAPSRMMDTLPRPGFVVTHTKVGVGDLKGGGCPDAGCVSSEACIAEFSGRRFVVVFQNIFNAHAHFRLVNEIVERTMNQFVQSSKTP